ncbi:hypothetical protein SAMN05421837_110204 [Amycolatopsis pretoriensis]|uniref:Uncharacterized protein n=1 Tax=Amycolatopsis pretoriensis TaxID=218821 RepID=A0A1H5RDP4_9PSEU|nr:hypothetical protein [Amycolatopsis pretoriensis]SEF36449.1 hypothetical protein SAMN05421837_110204 [Amycolatopsis pretoriensis]
MPNDKQVRIAELLHGIGMHREAEQALRTDLRARWRRMRRRLKLRLTGRPRPRGQG